MDSNEKGSSGWGGFSESGFDANIPVWDGRADSLREFRKTVTWWLHSINLEKTKEFNLAARFAMKQRGAAKIRALEFTPEELAYTPAEEVKDDESGETIVLTPAKYDTGINKILEAWDTMVGRSVTDKKGELRERYYINTKRAPGEAIINFALRYRNLLSEMKQEGIVIDEAESAWFFKQKLSISELQKQMLETTLGAQTEDYSQCEKEAIRLFKRIHLGQPAGQGSGKGMGKAPMRRPGLTSHALQKFRKGGFSGGSSATSTASSWSRRTPSSRFSNSVNVTDHDGEHDEQYYEQETEDFDAEHEAYEAEYDEVNDTEEMQQLQDTVEVLATELEEAAEEGCDEEELAGLEEQIDGAVEALVTLREARTQINAMRKDRGFKGPSSSSNSSKNTKDEGCFDCGAKDHWRGDPACPKRGKGGKRGTGGKSGPSKGRGKSSFSSSGGSPSRSGFRPGGKPKDVNVSEANVVDLLSPHPHVQFREVSFAETSEVHEINVAESLAVALTTSAARPSDQLPLDKVYQAAVDSACNRSCAGNVWVQTMVDALEFSPKRIRDLVQRVPEHELFKFGNGGTLVSHERIRLPVVIMDKVLLIWISTIPCTSLGCLLGKDLLEGLGAILDFHGKRVQWKMLAPQRWMKLSRMRAGHFSMNLLPRHLETWPQLHPSFPWIALGQAGVCEVQGESRLKFRLKQLTNHDQVGEVNVTDGNHMHFVPEHFISSSVTSRDVGFSPGADLHGRAMDADGGSPSSPAGVAHEGSDAMGDPETFSEMDTSTPTSYLHSRGLDHSSEGHGGTEVVAEVMVSESHATRSLHSDRSEGGHRSTVEARSPAEFLRGYRAAVRHRGTPEEAPRPSSSGIGGRDSTAAEPFRRRSRTPVAHPHGSPRRPTSVEVRTDRAGHTPPRSRGSRGYGGSDQDESEADGGEPEGEDRDGHEEGEGEAEADLRSSRSTTATHRTDSEGGAEEEGGSPAGGSDTLWHDDEPGWATDPSSEPKRHGGRLGRSFANLLRMGRQHIADRVLPAGQPGDVTSDESVEIPFDPHEHKDYGWVRKELSEEVRKSIGSVTSGMIRKLKTGVKQILHQAAQKAKRLTQALSVNVDEIREIMESEHYEMMRKTAEGKTEVLLADVLFPDVPEEKPPNPGREPTERTGNRKKRQKIPMVQRMRENMDEWRLGHHDGWICIDHWTPRRSLYRPPYASLPKWFPIQAFEGGRHTLIFDQETGDIVNEVEDNFWVHDARYVHPTPWVGQTWFRMEDAWILRYYPVLPEYHLPEEVQWVMADDRRIGTLTCPNGNKVFVKDDTTTYRGALPNHEDVLVSSYALMNRRWTMLECMQPWKKRGIHRIPYNRQYLAAVAEVLVVIYHEKDPGGDRQPLVGELYTDTEPVVKQAALKGYEVMPSLTLDAGYDFLLKEDREAADKQIKEWKPYALILAFPCGPWSPLMELVVGRDPRRLARLRRRRKQQTVLVNYAVDKAIAQISSGRHFLIENPSRSAAWKKCKRLKRLVDNAKKLKLFLVQMDQCMTGLVGPGGGPHRKRTWILTSSEEVAKELSKFQCDGNHDHEHVIGGKKVTEPAGHYTPRMAGAIVKGFEKQREKDFAKVNEACVVQEIEEMGEEANAGRDEMAAMAASPEGEEPEDDDIDVSGADEPTPEQRRAVMHLHKVTGHRSPLRLARALLLANAPYSVVKAAKQLKCEICQETRKVHARRPASLPRVRNFGDRIYVDLFSIRDHRDDTYWIAHAVDAATRFQAARLPDTKSSEEVGRFLVEGWFGAYGIPSAVTADMGPEFVSDHLQSLMDAHTVHLYHTAVEAPWVNGIAERAGGSLKVIMRAVMAQMAATGKEDMRSCLVAALEAVNGDTSHNGFSPAQWVLGKQPRGIGAVIPNDASARLAEHSMVSDDPSFARTVAMREVAKHAMVRMQYSAALRRAEMARSRVAPPWSAFNVGDVVYFFREQKWSGSPGRRRSCSFGSGMVPACCWLWKEETFLRRPT